MAGKIGVAASNRIDMIGKVYNSWTVISEAGRRGKIVLYNAVCSGCDRTFVVQGQNLRTGRSKTCVECGQLRSNKAKIGRKKSKKSAEQMRVEYLFRDKKKNAKSRGISWDLTIEQFQQLIFKNCHYTGLPPSNTVNILAHKGLHKDFEENGWITYNGIDRLNSSKGYEFNNCVPCSSIANKAKLDMSEAEFYEFISNAYTHLKKEGRL